MPGRKLKCECGHCRTCYNREYRRKHTSHIGKVYKFNINNPTGGIKVTSRPVHIGFSTDLLLDKLTDDEVYRIVVELGEFDYSASTNLPAY